MRIASIALRNFRSHVSTDVKRLGARLNVFAGSNNAGKSSILDAICLALTGTCHGALSGRSLSELRHAPNGRQVKGRWEVRLNLVGLHPDDEKRDAILLQRTEGQGPQSDFQRSVEQETGVSPHVVRCCLYAGNLLTMDRKDAQAMLLGLISNVVTMPGELASVVEWLGLDVHQDQDLDLRRCDAIYKAAYERRREVKREARPEAPGAPDIPSEFSDALAGKTADQVNDLCNLMDRKIRELEVEKSQAERSSGPSDLEDRIARGRARESELVALIESLDPKGISERCTKLLESQRALRETNRQIEEKRSSLTSAQAATSGELRQLAGHEAALKKVGEKGICDQCGRTLTRKAAEFQLEQLRKKIEPLSGQLAEIEDRMKGIPPLIGETTIEEGLRELRLAEERYVQASKDLDAVRKRLGELAAQQAATAPAAAPEIVSARLQLDGRILEGRRRLEVLNRYQGALAAHEKATALASSATSELEDLERLVEAFGPKGEIRAKLSESTSAFSEALAGLLSLFGYTCDMAPLLSLSDDPIVNGRPARLLSESEQMRFSAALGVALAKHTGFGIVGVDRWEALQGEAREATISLLMESGVQALTFGTLTAKITTGEWRERVAGTTFDPESVVPFYVGYEDGVSAVEGPA